MVRSENRVVQSDKMVVRRETRDKLVDLQMWHARRPARRLCYILRGWLLYARIARKMMRCKVQPCIEVNMTVSISLENNGEMRI